MSVIKLEAFGGMLPSVNPRLLPEKQAAYALNSYLYNGTMVGWRLPKLLFNLASPTTRMAFRIPVDEANRGITASAYWLEFDHEDTKVLRTPVINDTFKRYYYSAPGLQPSYNTLARIAAGSTAWLLGVPAPLNAPAVSPAGGSGVALAVARSYVYTYVTAYGEESAPSPPLVQNGYVDDTWVVTVADPPASDLGVSRNITTIRIYRTVTSSAGVASFFRVADVNVGTSTYNDSLTDDFVAEDDTLPSTTWTPPPTDLQGMVGMANGIFAGFRENEIWFCEPFRPHAWPSVYVLTTEFPIVGLGAIGQSLIVCTKGFPVVITGNSPDTMTDHVVRQAQPCNNSGSIVSATDAVYYSSPNGLQAVTPYGTIANVTESWIDLWQTVVPQNSVRAIMMGYTYFAFGSVYLNPETAIRDAGEAQDGFVVQSPQTSSQKVSAPSGSQITEPGFHYMSAPLDLDVVNLQVDYWTSIPYLIQNQKVYYYDWADEQPLLQSYTWRSKIIQDSFKRNFAVMRIWFTVPESTPDQNATRDTSAEQPILAADRYGIVRVYADDTLLTTREIRNSGELLRIRSGQKYEFWQFEFEARVEITGVQIATTVKELVNA